MGNNLNNKSIILCTRILNTYSLNLFLRLKNFSPICYRWNDIHLVELFLTIPECNPNCTDNDGRTPLALTNDTKTIKCLLTNGANSEKMYTRVPSRQKYTSNSTCNQCVHGWRQGCWKKHTSNSSHYRKKWNISLDCSAY